MDQIQAHFYGLPTIPMTLHPAFLANWIAISPTAPAAAETTTVYPAFRLPIFFRPKQAVNPEIPKTPKKSQYLWQFSGSLVSSLALRTEYFCQRVRPRTLSPILNFWLLEQMTSATPAPFMRSPGLTGSMQVLTPEIHILMLASMERQRFLTMTQPDCSSLMGTGGTYLSWKTSQCSGYLWVGALMRVICALQSTSFSWLMIFQIQYYQQTQQYLKQLQLHEPYILTQVFQIPQLNWYELILDQNSMRLLVLNILADCIECVSMSILGLFCWHWLYY